MPCTNCAKGCLIGRLWAERVLKKGKADAVVHSQPFYSTERITELVKDVEQDLQKLLGEEQGIPPGRAKSLRADYA